MGSLRFGRYEVIRTIASGGMATVYLARAVAEGGFERLVAIKVMHPHIAADPEFRAMFMDEARLAARIRHPNVVGVIDTQNSAEGMFLVMEYVDGPSLHQLRRAVHRKAAKVPVGTTLRIFVDVLTGLHDAHEIVGNTGAKLNLIHRDVSPQNILVGRDGVSRITDFGVARSEARITSTRGGQLKGKLAYMPPEQLHNEKLDRRADVYSTGCALWEALSGRRLFRADSEAGLLELILDGATESPRQRNPEVPCAVDEVCMRALSVDASARQPTAAAFADELEDAARRSGMEIATTRHVSTFVKGFAELAEEAVHVPSSPSGRTSAPGAQRLQTADVAWPERPDTVVTNGALVAASSRASMRRSRWPMIAGAVALGGVGAYFLLSRDEGSGGAASHGPEGAVSAAATEQAPSATARVSATAAPAGSATADVVEVPAEPKASAHASARVREPGPPRPAPAGGGKPSKPRPGPGGPGYIPPEL